MALTDDDLAAIRRRHELSPVSRFLCRCGHFRCQVVELLDEVDRLRALLDPPAWREDRDTAFIHGLENVGASDESIAVARKAVQ